MFKNGSRYEGMRRVNNSCRCVGGFIQKRVGFCGKIFLFSCWSGYEFVVELELLYKFVVRASYLG